MEKKYPFNLITPYVIQGYGINNQTPYEIEEVDAKELLTPLRIDLMAKWIYIDAKVKGWDMSYPTELYKAHLDSFSDGTFCEPGNKEKTSFQQYIQVFDELIRNFQKVGFDENVSLLPVGKGNVLLDGAHRCACAAYFNQRVKIIRFENVEQNFGYKFFEQRFLERKHLERLVLEYCRHNEKLFMACLWPAAKGKKLRDRAEKIIGQKGQIVYKRELKLNYRGMKSFITQIYAHQKWVGDFHDHYAGAEVKCKACYRRNRRVRMILFQCSDLETVLKMKQEIRMIFQIGNHSVHISDNAEETREMAELLLNRNSVFHMNCGHPNKMANVNQKAENLRTIYKEVNEKKKFDYMVNLQGSLAIFGIKDCLKIGGITSGNVPLLFKKNWEEDEKGGKALAEILQDTENYFMYRGVKYVMIRNCSIINGRHFKIYMTEFWGNMKTAVMEYLKMDFIKKKKNFDCRKREIKAAAYGFAVGILKKIGMYEWLKDKLY